MEGDQSDPPILTLAPEVLAHVFSQLNHLDAVSAAGVCPEWMDIVNGLVLRHNGHLVLHQKHDDQGRPHPPVNTIHLINARDVLQLLQSASRTTPLRFVRTVWLHEQLDSRAIPSLKSEAFLRATLDAIFLICPDISSINFSNVPQCAMLLQLLVDRGPRPRFRTRCVFTQRDHNANSALVVLEELGAFFQETVVTILRPVVTITAQYAHYWNPTKRLSYPFQDDARTLCLHASGLASTALTDVACMIHLRVLHLYDAASLDDDALTAITSSVWRLARLSIHDAPGVSSACWAAAFRSRALSELESLHLSGCPQLDDEAFDSTNPTETLTGAELDLESCTKLSRQGFQRFMTLFPHLQVLAVAVPFTPTVMEGLLLAPELLRRLRRLTVRVQGSTWSGDAKVVISGVEKLKKDLRGACPTHVQMDISLTFVKLGLAVSNDSDLDDEL